MLRRSLLAGAASFLATAAFAQPYHPGFGPGFKPGFQFGDGGFPAADAIADYDFKGNRFYGPALTVTRAGSATIDDTSGNWTAVAADTLRRSDKGALIEEARTNDVPNSSTTGAVLGVLGAGAQLPTGWNTSGTQGVPNRQVTFIGTVKGVEVVGIRFWGVPTTTAPQTLTFQSSISSGLATVRSVSLFVALVGGDMTNISAGQLWLRSGVEGGQTNITPTADLTRYTNTRTLANSAEGAVTLRWNYNDTTTPVDFTIYLGWPQGENAAFATSPIRTTGTAATRAADVVTGTVSGLTAATLALVARPNTPLVNAANQVVATVSDGTTGSRILIGRAAGTGTIYGGTHATTFLSATTVNPDIRFSAAAAFAASDRAISVNGATVVTNAAVEAFPVGLVQINVGNNGAGGVQFNGYLERFVIYPTRRPNADLQLLSTLANWGG